MTAPLPTVTDAERDALTQRERKLLTHIIGGAGTSPSYIAREMVAVIKDLAQTRSALAGMVRQETAA